MTRSEFDFIKECKDYDDYVNRLKNNKIDYICSMFTPELLKYIKKWEKIKKSQEL